MAGGLQKATPERTSEHVKTTGSVALIHPLGLGGRERAPVMVGGVRSMFTLESVVLAELPARSEQEPVADWP